MVVLREMLHIRGPPAMAMSSVSESGKKIVSAFRY